MLAPSMWDAVGITDIGSRDFSFSIEDENGEELIAPKKLHIEIPGISISFDNTGEELYNNNGIRIISKGILADDSEYSDDVHLLLMVENMTDSTIKISDVYNSLSVNGFMTDAIMYDTEVDENETAVMDVEIPDYSLEDNQISSVDDITSIELSIEIKGNDRKIIDEVTISVSR